MPARNTTFGFMLDQYAEVEGDLANSSSTAQSQMVRALKLMKTKLEKLKSKVEARGGKFISDDYT